MTAVQFDMADYLFSFMLFAWFAGIMRTEHCRGLILRVLSRLVGSLVWIPFFNYLKIKAWTDITLELSNSLYPSDPSLLFFNAGIISLYPVPLNLPIFSEFRFECALLGLIEYLLLPLGSHIGIFFWEHLALSFVETHSFLFMSGLWVGFGCA